MYTPKLLKLASSDILCFLRLAISRSLSSEIEIGSRIPSGSSEQHPLTLDSCGPFRSIASSTSGGMSPHKLVVSWAEALN